MPPTDKHIPRHKLAVNSAYGKLSMSSFPGEAWELDLLTIVARLIDLKNSKSGNQEWIIYQLTTSDLPRLENYLSQRVKDWSGLYSNEKGG